MICKHRGAMVVDWIHLAKISVLWRLLVHIVIKFFPALKYGREAGHVVGIMTELRTVRFGFKFRHGLEMSLFSKTSKKGFGAHPDSQSVGTGVV